MSRLLDALNRKQGSSAEEAVAEAPSKRAAQPPRHNGPHNGETGSRATVKTPHDRIRPSILSIPSKPEREIPFIEVPEDRDELPGSNGDSVQEEQSEEQTGRCITFEKPEVKPTKPNWENIPEELVVWHSPHSPEAGQYIQTGKMLLGEMDANDASVVILKTIEPCPQFASITTNIASAMVGCSNRSVLLIDMDVVDCPITELLGLPASLGWNELIAGVPPAHLIQESGYAGLHVLAAGAPLAAARSGLLIDAVAQAVDKLEECYDIIILHSGRRDHAQLPLTGWCDAVCFVQSRGEEGASEAAQSPLMGIDGVRVLGTLVVGTD